MKGLKMLVLFVVAVSLLVFSATITRAQSPISDTTTFYPYSIPNDTTIADSTRPAYLIQNKIPAGDGSYNVTQQMSIPIGDLGGAYVAPVKIEATAIGNDSLKTLPVPTASFVFDGPTTIMRDTLFSSSDSSIIAGAIDFKLKNGDTNATPIGAYIRDPVSGKGFIAVDPNMAFSFETTKSEGLGLPITNAVPKENITVDIINSLGSGYKWYPELPAIQK